MVNVAASQQEGPEFECTGWVLFLRILRVLPVLVWVFRSQHIPASSHSPNFNSETGHWCECEHEFNGCSYMTQNKGSSEVTTNSLFKLIDDITRLL